MALLSPLFSAAGVSISDLTDPKLWSDYAFGAKTVGGVPVTPEGALRLSQYFACLRVVSEDEAMIPIDVIRQTDGKHERRPDHPVSKLLNFVPNPEMNAMSVRETTTHYAAGWGGGFCEIERTVGGEPIALWPIHPSRIKVWRNKNAELIYLVRIKLKVAGKVGGTTTFNFVEIPQMDMFHLHGLGPDGWSGYSVANIGAQSIGLALAAQEFAVSMFQNSAVLGGILSHPKRLDPKARKALRDGWATLHGGPGRAFGTAVLEEGVEWKQAGIPPKDAQFIQLREFEVEDICRWFRVDPSKVQSKLGGALANLEAREKSHWRDAIRPWATRWDQEGKRKLLDSSGDTDLVLKHDFNSILVADANSQATWMRTMTSSGIITVNQALGILGLNEIGPEGDVNVMQMNMTTLKEIAAGTNLSSTQNSAGGSEQDGGRPAAVAVAIKPAFQDAAERIAGIEGKALSRAASKHEDQADDFNEWLVTFSRQHLVKVSNEFEGPITVLFAVLAQTTDAKLMSAAWDVAQDFAKSHIDRLIVTAQADFAAGMSSKMEAKRGAPYTRSMAGEAMNMALQTIEESDNGLSN